VAELEAQSDELKQPLGELALAPLINKNTVGLSDISWKYRWH